MNRRLFKTSLSIKASAISAAIFFSRTHIVRVDEEARAKRKGIPV